MTTIDKNGKSKINIFPSINEVARAFNIHYRSVRKRIASKNFPNWKWA